MKIPKYCARTTQSAQDADGRTFALVCWQWSDVSAGEARQRADDRVREVARKVEAGAQLNRYGYDERPLREELIEGVKNHTGAEVGIVTRNLYGARVLNTTNAMFIDIDFGEQGAPARLAGPFQRLLGGRPASQTDQHLQRIAAWAGQRPDLSLRVYRTFGGLRCLIANQVFEPGGAESLGILQALGSDPLYVRLCRA